MCTIIYEQINSTHLELVTDDTVKPTNWDLINKKGSWKRIAGQENFDFGGDGSADGPP